MRVIMLNSLRVVCVQNTLDVATGAIALTIRSMLDMADMEFVGRSPLLRTTINGFQVLYIAFAAVSFVAVKHTD